MALIKPALLAICTVLAVSGCAGTEGTPVAVKQILEEKYIGKHVDEAFLDLGPADEREQLSSGNYLYSWTRQSNKYDTNLFIKSDERCSISIMADKDGIVRKIGTVDDSLGAWEISYCKEQFSL